MSSTPEIRLVLVTVPAQQGEGSLDSRNIVRILVTEGLAACVNRVPGLVSTYLWDNELHDDDEELLLIKTTKRNVSKLMKRIQELHPYKVPEILVLDVDSGLPSYLQWVADQCAKR